MIPYLTLPYITLHYLTLPYLTLPYRSIHTYDPSNWLNKPSDRARYVLPFLRPSCVQGPIGMLICNCFGLVPTKERDATLGIS